jgi:simple sugar transport system ATP-binding protein
LLEICDRLAVIAQGRLSEAKPLEQTSAEEIGMLMAGSRRVDAERTVAAAPE